MVNGMHTDSKFSRRDFLKLMALAPAALAARPLVSALQKARTADAPHVLIFIFDAWTAHNLQLHGYPRRTMPNLERFAERCFVYHNHYSTGSFTVPGTASMLTGLYPWNHRAVQLTAGGVAPAHQDHNIFAALADTHSAFGYSQNPYADIFLYQFEKYLDTYLAEAQFNLESRQISSLPIFRNDAQIAFASFENNILRNGKGTSGSLFLGMLSRLNGLRNYASIRQAHIGEYPAGVPIASGVFLLDDLVDGMMNAIRGFDSPTLAYFHVFPPHEPYAPKADFAGLFDDGWVPPEKPPHPLSRARHPWEEIVYNRLRYDQYMAAWDAEFARLLDYLETSGLLDNSLVILTSDHGEMFERGEIGHNTFVLVRVPLLISLPGQTQRKDIHAFTSGVDLVPTIASLAGAGPPAWTEGRLLPGLGGEEDLDRSVYCIDAKMASSFSVFNQFSISLIKQRHRLIQYQYPHYSGFEFYNLDEDPEEVNDLYPSEPALAKQMKDEVLQKVEEFNRPYQKK
jgi:arylsulfatase A-like enzyme